MAVIEVEKTDLEAIVGRSLKKEDIEYNIPMLGLPLERQEENKVAYEVFPNRPDMLSTEGIGRAVRSFLGIKGPVEYRTKRSGVSLSSEAPHIRPYIACSIAKNLKLDETALHSLMQLQEKLHETLCRKRKKSAIGLHNLDAISTPLIYKTVSPETKFVPLGEKSEMSLIDIIKKHQKGKEYGVLFENAKKYPVIEDNKGEIISFPPIINSELTKITVSTKNIFVDVTGTDKKTVEQVINIVTAALTERGGEIYTVTVNGRETPDMSYRKIKTDINYINSLLGLNLDEKTFSGLLKKMGIGYKKEVLVPPYRTDIMHQIDIAEEIAIAYNYNSFVPKLPSISTQAEREEKQEFFVYARNILAGLGLQEVITTILTNENNEFRKMRLKESLYCRTSNPLSKECTICRKTIMPSLLKTLSQNRNREYPQKIFELGDIILVNKEAETGAENRKSLAVLVSDTTAGYESVSTLLDAFIRSLGMRYRLRPSESPQFIKGRTAHVFIENHKAGTIGEIHPEVLNNWNIEMPVAGFEIDMEVVYSLHKTNLIKKRKI